MWVKQPTSTLFWIIPRMFRKPSGEKMITSIPSILFLFVCKIAFEQTLLRARFVPLSQFCNTPIVYYLPIALLLNILLFGLFVDEIMLCLRQLLFWADVERKPFCIQKQIGSTFKTHMDTCTCTRKHDGIKI